MASLARTVPKAADLASLARTVPKPLANVHPSLSVRVDPFATGRRHDTRYEGSTLPKLIVDTWGSP